MLSLGVAMYAFFKLSRFKRQIGIWELYISFSYVEDNCAHAFVKMQHSIDFINMNYATKNTLIWIDFNTKFIKIALNLNKRLLERTYLLFHLYINNNNLY